ncbi:MAG: glycosyltransferase family 2 protein [Clostridia bacterium]|nr:glycosyltransferase family 2 protein [Clostridia bacterium]
MTLVVGILFVLMYSYQFFYAIFGFFKKPKSYPATDQSKRYAVVISARNEELVLPHLIQSIKEQTYPADKITIYVIADNCTDRTAEVVRELGAVVLERQDKEKIGKGYALEFLFNHISANGSIRDHDAYIIMDADNLMRPNYIEEMDKAYCAGNRILCSYRNSKNYDGSWVSAGYSLWFMRDSRLLNHPRTVLGASACATGTGFLIDSEIIERNGGWKHFLLTEDVEFTVDSLMQGERVGYCHNAEFFDEQPEKFGQSWRQRKRWAKGYFQVVAHYAKPLAKHIFRGSWSLYDITMNYLPALLLSSLQIFAMVVLLALNGIFCQAFSLTLLFGLLSFLVGSYFLFFFMGLLTIIAEWKHIYCKKWKAILHLFTFPIFMLSYLPIAVVALFTKVEWKPIAHKHVLSTNDVAGDSSAPAEGEQVTVPAAEGESTPEQ